MLLTARLRTLWLVLTLRNERNIMQYMQGEEHTKNGRRQCKHSAAELPAFVLVLCSAKKLQMICITKQE